MPPNPVDIHVGQRLRARRILMNISLEKLAAGAGITFQQIQKYERGANRVSASRLWQFARILDVPISYFFENFRETTSASAPAPSYGLSDNEQEEFLNHDNLMTRKETLDLVREYYSIPDEKMRRDLLKMIRTMAASMRSSAD